VRVSDHVRGGINWNFWQLSKVVTPTDLIITFTTNGASIITGVLARFLAGHFSLLNALGAEKSAL
jgi:hypothetical protein